MQTKQLTPQHKKIDWFFIFLLACSIAILASCSSKHLQKSSVKINTETEASTDLTAVKKTDSTGTSTAENAAVKHSDSSAVKTTTTEATETITVNLDTARGTPANDFAGAPRVFDVNINGHQIHSNRPINNIVIQNKQGTQVIDAHQVITSDSAGGKTSQTSTVSTADSLAMAQKLKEKMEMEAKAKELKKTGGLSFGGWIFWILAALVIGVGWYFGWWGWLLALAKRVFKKKEVNPLHSVKYNPPPPPDSTNA